MIEMLEDNYTRWTKITNIVDGDTLDGFVDLGYRIWTEQRFRLLGVNTPERGKLGATEATEYVRTRLLNKKVSIRSEKDDAFGRWLAIIFIDGTTINLELLEYGYAVPYLRK
jgi:micrococcal nuclease